MSNFTYEVDERNLRLKMKEFTVPVKEEAWQKFESFSETQGNQNGENRLKNFSFSLNRSVVLPSVFGVIIILFSFLLVNFVSIKNPSRVNEQKVEVKALVTPAAEPVVAAKVATPVQVPVAEIKPEVKAEPVIVEQKVEEKVAAAPEVKAEEIAVIPAKIESSTDAVANDEKARLKAERRAARAAERQKLREISPTPISEEGDSEVRPD